MKIYKIFLKRKHIELQKIVKIYNIIESSNIPFLTPKNIQLSDSVSYKAHTCNNIFPKDIISYMKHQEENINSNINRDITINLIKSRSNVGKSSLINNLLNTELTKVSKEPGKTNFLQFINLPALNLSLVDCPGYGYANKSINERKKWDVMMQVYLSTNKKLERIIILIDPLVGITEMDQQLFKFAQKLSINFNIVFTKLDKIKRVNDIEVILKNTKEILMNYTFYSPFVIFTSSKLGLGFTELKCFLMFSKSLSENMSQTRRR